MASPPSIQKTVKVHRPRSSQRVSVSWDEADDADASGAARLQFEVAECVETKTITTTTTTKRSYPPMFVRDPRPLHLLDTKEYPLASRATPPELSRFTLDLPADDHLTWTSDEPVSQTPSEQLASDISRIPTSRKEYLSSKPESPVDSLPDSPTTKQSARSALQSRSRKLKGLTTSLQKKPRHSSAPNSVSDKLRRAVAHGARRENERSASRGPTSTYPATPDASEMSLGFPDQVRLRAPEADEDDSLETRTTQNSSTSGIPNRRGSDGPAMFSGAVATPPITDADAEPFANLDESLQESVRALHHPRPTIDTVAAQDASLPSPRLSPTLQAAQLHTQTQEAVADGEQDLVLSRALSRRDRSYFMDESQTTEEGDSALTETSPTPFSRRLELASPQSQSSIFDSRSMLESFDAMPNEMKTFMMYQFLRRCSRKTLRMVSDVVNPALKCDFLRQLPLELSLHVLSYLDHTDLCRVAQVSKHWRNIADSNETGWKELFDRDGFELSQTELERAITQGWGWQDPVGVEGCEVDLSMQTRLTSTDIELFRAPAKTETMSKLRSAKRKRSLVTVAADRVNVKRRARLQDMAKEEKPETSSLYHKSKGPLSAANAAVLAVPNPQIGLPSLRRLHLFKSLYRRHHMIRQSWTSGKVKPGHVAFAAHPRHVITCLQFDDDKIITGSDDTLINIYDTKTGELRKTLEGHEGGVWALQYEGNILVSGSTDRTVRVWDIEKGLCNQMFYGHTSTVRCLQIVMPTETGRFQDGRPVMMPTKPLIITGSRDSQLRVWRLPEAGSRRYIQTGPPARDEDCPFFIRVLAGHTHSVRAISAHGDILVSGSYDSTVRVWRISTGEALHVLSGHNQKVYSVVLDHQRNRCISGSMDSLVKIWDLDTGACLHTLEGHSLLVGLLDLRDERLVSAAADSTLRIWDPETGKCKSTLMAHTGAITCFQHDGRKVISGSEKTVKMWDIHTGECIQDLLTDLSGVWQVKFDGRRCVAAVQRDNLTYVEILDFGAIRDGKPPEELGKRILLNAPAVQQLIEEEA